MLKYILLQIKYHSPNSVEWLVSTFWTFYLHIQRTSASTDCAWWQSRDKIPSLSLLYKTYQQLVNEPVLSFTKFSIQHFNCK